MMKSWQFIIPAHLDGERLDLAIVAFDLGLSRRKIRAVIDAGGIYINRKRMRVASRKVKAGDQLRIEYNEASLQKIKAAEFAFQDTDILFDDLGIIAVNKPPGLPSQETRDQSVQHVAPLLRAYLEVKEGAKPRLPILVHRLDKETSGVLLLARDGKIANALTEQFRERTMRKSYLALCAGVPEVDDFAVSNYLAPIDRKTGMVRSVRSGGKTANTEFKVLGRKGAVSLIQCFPKTGRSHQIRVHLADKGYAILGDKRYSRGEVEVDDAIRPLLQDHHFLHAHSLGFEIAGRNISLLANLPPNFEKALAILGFAAKIESL